MRKIKSVKCCGCNSINDISFMYDITQYMSVNLKGELLIKPTALGKLNTISDLRKIDDGRIVHKPTCLYCEACGTTVSDTDFEVTYDDGSTTILNYSSTDDDIIDVADELLGRCYY